MSDLRRRTFLALAAAAVATATTTTATATSAFAALAQAATSPSDLMRRSRFTQHVGSTFTMTSSAGRWSVALEAVEDLAPGGSPGAEKQFAAAFSGGGPGDGVYTFSRKGFTPTALFVVASSDSRRATVNCV